MSKLDAPIKLMALWPMDRILTTELCIFPDFDAAARAVLVHLRGRLDFDLWMVTRTEGQDWTVLQVEDHGYGVKEGVVFKWEDTICFHMFHGDGPRVAPCVADVAAYAAAPLLRQVAVGAYMGVPLVRDDGSLFGTLCAIDPSSKPKEIVKELPLVELCGQLLSTILDREIRAAEQTRLAERMHAEAMRDPLTGLYNRRGWESLIAAEEARCRRYGHAACVVSIDLDGLKVVNDTLGHARGDELIRRASAAILSAARTADIAARVGGDEFLILLVECDGAAAAPVLRRLRKTLAACDVKASIGIANYSGVRRMTGTVEEADRRMYANKNERHSTASAH